LEVQGSAGGQQQGFVDRLRYLDSLKVRGMLLPERAILEGQHGTLAESQSQGDLALLQAELVHHHITREINHQAVDPVLEANWGRTCRGKVRLEAAPLSDANQAFFRQLVTQVLSDPKDFAELFRRADWPSIFDAVGLPQSKAPSAAPGSAPAMLSTVGQIHREGLQGVDGHAAVARRKEYVAAQPSKVHSEADVADTLRLANFNPSQPRDKYGRWTKGASGEAGAAGEGGASGVADSEGTSAGPRPQAVPPSSRDYSAAGYWVGGGMHDYFDGHYSSAIEKFDRAIGSDANNALAYYYRGLARLALGDEQSARIDFEKGSALEHVYGGGVGRALERIQGPVRQLLECYRKQGEHWASASAVLSILKESNKFKEMQKGDATLASDLYAWFHKVVSKLSDKSLRQLLTGGLSDVMCFPDKEAMLKKLKEYPYLSEVGPVPALYDPVRRTLWCYVGGEGGIRLGSGAVLAHELAHAIDAGRKFSGSDAWNEAWSSEIKERPISDEEKRRLERERFGDKPEDQIPVEDLAKFWDDLGKRSTPLGLYGAKNAEEGFAEFLKSVLLADFPGRTDAPSRQELKQKSPKCWSFFESNGLIPLP
jgi:tetratricopeptide (TPR) repeat protein